MPVKFDAHPAHSISDHADVLVKSGMFESGHNWLSKNLMRCGKDFIPQAEVSTS
jgi:hypothetical protein